jgi:hypothetical protein
MTDQLETTLARITNASLGYEDHGLLTSFLMLEYAETGARIGGTGQGFGGYSLGGKYTNRWVMGVLDATGAKDWSEVKGKLVWATHTWTKVHSITGIDTGSTFDPTTWKDKE